MKETLEKVDVIENSNGGNDKWYHIGSGIKSDLSTRIPYYWSDFKDGLIGKNTIQKTISTTLFLYFRYLSCILTMKCCHIYPYVYYKNSSISKLLILISV